MRSSEPGSDVDKLRDSPGTCASPGHPGTCAFPGLVVLLAAGEPRGSSIPTCELTSSSSFRELFVLIRFF